MNYYQLHVQAESKWNDSVSLRQQYPTFAFYWYERYERVYDIPAAISTLFRLYHGKLRDTSLKAIATSLGLS